MTGKPVRFELGTGFVSLTCPECATRVEVAMTLGTKLTVDDTGDPGSLRPTLKAKAVEHSCRGLITEPLFPVADAS